MSYLRIFVVSVLILDQYQNVPGNGQNQLDSDIHIDLQFLPGNLLLSLYLPMILLFYIGSYPFFFRLYHLVACPAPATFHLFISIQSISCSPFS